MPYVPSHLRNQATESAPAPSSNPFGRSQRTEQGEMPSAFASSKRRSDDPHANPSAFAWGKPRESNDVVPLAPTKLAPVISAKNPAVVKTSEGGPTFEVYDNGAMNAMSASAPAPAPEPVQSKPAGYVPPAQRVAQAAAPKTYDELFPSLGGGVAPAPKSTTMKFSAPSSAGRSWAAIAQDDTLRLEAIRRQEEEQQAQASIRLNMDDIANTSWADLLDMQNEGGDEASYCYDYRG